MFNVLYIFIRGLMSADVSLLMTVASASHIKI